MFTFSIDQQQKAVSILQNPTEALQNAKRAYPRQTGNDTLAKKVKLDSTVPVANSTLDSGKHTTSTINEKDIKMESFQSEFPMTSES